MNLLSSIFGVGTAKCKRARRGMERDWNRYDEYIRKLMLHGDSMKKSKRYLKHLKEKSEPAPDNES